MSIQQFKNKLLRESNLLVTSVRNTKHGVKVEWYGSFSFTGIDGKVSTFRDSKKNVRYFPTLSDAYNQL